VLDGAAALLRGARGATCVASGGTATALAALDLGLATYDPARVHGHVLEASRLTALEEALRATPAEAVRRRGGLDPGRARILPAGAAVLAAVMRATGAPALQVSDHGVRHAYLRERLAAVGVAADLRRLWE
jgi:exopolyphosphatase/guanosine-5'-triphosphate,3'-diphosphate pyrophosphatase